MANVELTADVKDIDATVAVNILQELHHVGKISDKIVEECREKFYQLHEYLVKSMQNDKFLIKKARQLKEELLKENLNLEKTTSQQKDNEETLNQLTETIENASREIEVIEQRVNILDYEIQQLEHEKIEMENSLSEIENKVRVKLQPEIEMMKRDLADFQEEIDANELKAERGKKEEEKYLDETEKLMKKIEDHKDKIEKLSADLGKIKDDPSRIKRSNEILKNAIKSLNEDHDKVKKDLKKKHDDFKDAENKKVEHSEKKDYHTGTIKELRETLLTQEKKMDEMNKSLQYLKEQMERTMGIRVEQDLEIKSMEDQKKREQDKINAQSKKKEELKTLYKKVEKVAGILENHIKEFETEKASTYKTFEEYKSENVQQNKIKENLDDENALFISQIAKKEIIHSDIKDKISKKKAEILDAEKRVAELQQEENKWLEEIKLLSTIREKMARTASQAMSQARETREELKVKELLILDLTKKHQETEFRLNSFIALYDEVKNARNKYVNLIQNSSQDLAELKERIKILQNEVEILRNESSEKDRNLVDAKHSVQLEIYKRDSSRAELNKKKFVYAQKQSIINQEINEQQKLHLILTGIQKEMADLIHKYEQACESRNYMGIQLIDRNDELCILYEKANIQENILKNGEQEIREKEEEIRMMNLELAEKQRHIEVLRKKVPSVPELAEQVINLKTELDKEKERVKDLSERVEDPDPNAKGNSTRVKEIDAEIPDQESLQAKIQVLEERLNNKKEGLLEKELVLEEITNLSEKLRKQALDGRKGTLELAEKINEFKARTTELSRKMLATVAEVSMFQATAMKLEQEKEEREAQLESAQERFQNGLPPTDDCEKEWARMQRETIRKLDQKDLVAKKAEIEKNMAYLGVKTTAKPRHTTYISTDTGLYEHYGGEFAPFYPSEQGANIRHIRKPVEREIEI